MKYSVPDRIACNDTCIVIAAMHNNDTHNACNQFEFTQFVELKVATIEALVSAFIGDIQKEVL